MLMLLIAGCIFPDADSGGQSGEEGVRCEAVTTADYALTETTPLGFTGQQVIDLVVGTDTVRFDWAEGGATELTLTVETTATTVTWRDNEYVDDGSGMEPAIDCADDLVLPVSVGFVTTDGKFDESWTLDIAATAADAASAFRTVDLSALGGTYTVTEVDPADFDEVSAYVDLRFGAAGPSGAVEGQAVKNGDASDPDSTSSASFFGIGEFGG